MSKPVAIVSGGAQGLGQAFSERLAHEGFQVLSFDIQKHSYQCEGVTAITADIREQTDVEHVVATAAEMGRLAVLVNNAGIWRRTPVTSDWQQALQDWDDVMTTNLKGTLMLTRASVPHLKQEGGHIFNISTYYVLPARSPGTNQPDTDLYNASKWALNGFTDAWAKTLANYQIAVNGICMGAVDTPMLRGFFEGGNLPAGLAADVLETGEIAQQLIEIMDSGRTGENFGAWAGEPVDLGPQPAPHQRITGIIREEGRST